MKLRTSMLGLAVLAIPAFAQTPQGSSNAMQDAQSQKKDPMMMQESAPPSWTMLKGHEKGYVAIGDLPTNSWLATNFKACDKDSDGKVTQSEYAACQKMPKKP